MTVENTTAELNWAGNHRYRAARIEHPGSVEELAGIVAGAERVRALGSRHSFNDIADTEGTLVCLDRIAAGIVIDAEAMTVRVGAGVRYGTLATELARQGFALHNLASLPHISVAGAVATATHGSGDRNGNLATAVVGLRFIDGAGREHTVSRAATPDFAGYVVGLGALGIVTELTLRIEPHFTVAQHVLEDLPWENVLANLDAVTSAAYSVSLFTDWRADTVGQAWFKRRAATGATDPGAPSSFFGGRAAAAPRHPVPGVSAENCTEQLGVPGSWADRLAHFRMDYLPSSGDEIQSEYLVGREHAVAAIAAMRALSGTISPLLQVAEIRTIAADDLWLSPNHGRDGIGLHFTWQPDQPAVERVLPVIEAALAPFGARPHWGKAFHAGAAELAPLYPRFDDFRALARRLDPEGKFRNGFLDRVVPA
ncbi:FAD-binding protein [Specibacter cremeus]|uniref:FAD-binding protein n=1 Tax=Specibacter cremeus TaxID=1629051 RepID=UPI000F778199|nr:FAD-binding protein [Specibacter cremeus]